MPCDENLTADTYVLVKYTTKSTVSYYVGKIQASLPDKDLIDSDENGIDVKFMKRVPSKSQSYSFIWPDNEDVDTVDKDDIEIVLPNPQIVGGTKRMAHRFVFNEVDFTPYF